MVSGVECIKCINPKPFVEHLGKEVFSLKTHLFIEELWKFENLVNSQEQIKKKQTQIPQYIFFGPQKNLVHILWSLLVIISFAIC